MHQIAPYQHKQEPLRYGQDDVVGKGETEPIEKHARAEAAHQGIGPPQRCALQPGEQDNVQEAQHLHDRGSHHEHAEAAVEAVVQRHRDDDKKQVKERHHLVSQLLAVIRKKISDMTHIDKRW